MPDDIESLAAVHPESWEVAPAAIVDLDDTVDSAEPVTTTVDDTQHPSAQASGERPQVTFMGNAYDLTSVLAVVTGVLALVSCLSCGWAFYCLPVLPLILGVIGLLAAKQSVDAERTRLLSWLGIGGGGIGLIILLLGIVAYVAFLGLIVTWGMQGDVYPYG